MTEGRGLPVDVLADIKRDTQRLVLDVGSLVSKVDDVSKAQARLNRMISKRPTKRQLALLFLFVLAVLVSVNLGIGIMS
ncbi:hypothetical protein [Inquilinus limosus]|uniref:Uncharacterized protein n=1 Tax=Inquilinus limosus TaxID=171674 RepID=A0A211ZQH9_9PROT|nr:hypothetical protein [Inquilinus limosus]OWJ67436.1 hypothetical protein BWR60_09525 [Inquilinus limosus]